MGARGAPAGSVARRDGGRVRAQDDHDVGITLDATELNVRQWGDHIGGLAQQQGNLREFPM